MRTDTLTYSLGPSQTPRAVWGLIVITSMTTILVALLEPLLRSFALPSLYEILSLSWKGVFQHYFIWQFLTFLFVIPSFHGITIFLLIQLLFSMYILWILGSALAERFSSFSVVRLYLESSILTGLCMIMITSYPLAGCTASLFALFVAWTMLNPEGEMLLFFVFPIKTKWLLSGIVGGSLLISISQGDLVGFIVTIVGCLYGYLFSAFGWNLTTPFSFTHSLDHALGQIGSKWRQRERNSHSQAKIVDFKTGKPVEKDDEFVDAMLAKISEFGEDSLSWNERRRLTKISKKKQK